MSFSPPAANALRLCRLSLLLTLQLLTGPSSNATAGTARKAAERPNIVFILADDLGYGDLGCYGQTVIQTPELDRMAAEGLRFTDFYCGSTVCAPSRSCLMTGQHTGHTYMRGNGPVWLRPDPLDRTVAACLQEAGYQTCMIGKSSTSGQVPPQLDQPNRKGFDHFFGVLSHQEAHHYFPPKMYRNGSELLFAANRLHSGDTYCHDLYLQEAREWIADPARQQQPFFLFYSSHIPHASLYAPEEWVARYRGKVGPERVVRQGHYRGSTEPNAEFAGMVGRLDWEVGQLLAALRQAGLDDKTVVMFASDNGAQSAGGHSENDFNSSGPLRGEKRDMYEGGIRTPFLVRWPGTVKPGVSAHVGAFWDFLPTACELAGVTPPAHIDGLSFAPTLTGQGQQQQHDFLYWEFFEKGGRRALRMGDYKAVQNDVFRSPTGPVEIYHLPDDLAETQDLAATHPELVEKARQLFLTARTKSPLPQFNYAGRAAGKKRNRKPRADQSKAN